MNNYPADASPHRYPMTNNAKRIHVHLRGDDPLTLDELTRDFAVIGRIHDDQITRADILTALKELEALGLASREDGKWKWLPEREKVRQQRTLF